MFYYVFVYICDCGALLYSFQLKTYLKLYFDIHMMSPNFGLPILYMYMYMTIWQNFPIKSGLIFFFILYISPSLYQNVRIFLFNILPIWKQKSPHLHFQR